MPRLAFIISNEFDWHSMKTIQSNLIETIKGHVSKKESKFFFIQKLS